MLNLLKRVGDNLTVAKLRSLNLLQVRGCGSEMNLMMRPEIKRSTSRAMIKIVKGTKKRKRQANLIY